MTEILLVEKVVHVGNHDEVVFQIITNKAGATALYAGGLEQGDMPLADLGRLSIAKWETMVVGYEAGAIRINDMGSSTCAFCQRFGGYNKKERTWCRGCPIAAYTGEPECYSTPYWDYTREFDEPCSTPEALKAAAQEELEFVEAVVEWMVESGYKVKPNEIPF